MSSEPSNRIDDEACEWAVRIDRGLSGEEQAQLAEWVGADTRRRGALARAQAAWSLLDRARALRPSEEEAEEVQEEALPAQSRTRRQLLQLGGGIAAMVLGAAAWRFRPMGEQFATAMGEIRRLPLEDGSLAMVNSASDIRVVFSSDRRDIQLSQGEAWFKVAKNKSRPFTVAAGQVNVQAVGTEFNVRRHDGYSNVIVTEGVVKIWSAATPNQPLLVQAGNRARIGEFGGVEIGALSAANMDQQLAWREGRIILDDMTLSAAAAEFNRYNKVKLVIDPAFADQRVIGWFRFDELEEFANASATLTGGRKEIGNGIIKIIQQPRDNR